MNDYFLSKIMEYIKQGKIKVSFEVHGGENPVYYLITENVKTKQFHRFKVKKGDVAVIKFMIETEEIVNAFRC
jgi:hypothetical protein